MNYRKLRIAWSVGWGVLAVLLIVLWMRSAWQGDARLFKWTEKQRFAVMSLLGEVGFAYVGNADNVGIDPSRKLDWEENPYYPYSGINRTAYPRITERNPPFKARFRWTRTRWSPGLWYVGAPYWFLTLATAAIATVPWIQLSRRFSVRTLLIATTLVALVLGLIVWAARQ
jgi:hypothetical protein